MMARARDDERNDASGRRSWVTRKYDYTLWLREILRYVHAAYRFCESCPMIMRGVTGVSMFSQKFQAVNEMNLLQKSR
jgi:hypothetical protein